MADPPSPHLCRLRCQGSARAGARGVAEERLRRRRQGERTRNRAPVRPPCRRRAAAPAQGYELPDQSLVGAAACAARPTHLVWRARPGDRPAQGGTGGRPGALGQPFGLHRPLPPGDPGNRGARRLPLGQGAPTRNPGLGGSRSGRRLSCEVSDRPPPARPPPAEAWLRPAATAATRHDRARVGIGGRSSDVQIELRPQTGTSLGVTSTFPRSMHTGAASRDRRVA